MGRNGPVTPLHPTSPQTQQASKQRQSVGEAASTLQTHKGKSLFPAWTFPCKSHFLFAIKEIKGDTRKQFFF